MLARKSDPYKRPPASRVLDTAAASGTPGTVGTVAARLLRHFRSLAWNVTPFCPKRNSEREKPMSNPRIPSPPGPDVPTQPHPVPRPGDTPSPVAPPDLEQPQPGSP